MVRTYLVITAAILTGCTHYSPDRIALSDARVEARRIEAAGMGDEEKAAYLWQRLHEHHVHEGAVMRCADSGFLCVEHTAAYLTMLAWRHMAVGDCTGELSNAVVALVNFDRADGAFDGRFVFEKTVGGTVTRPEAHANVYSQVIHAYVQVLRNVGTSQQVPTEIAWIISAHLSQIVIAWRDSGWNLGPGADLTGALTGVHPADALTLLVLCAVGRTLNIETLPSDIQGRLRLQAQYQCISTPFLFFPTHSSVWLAWLDTHTLATSCRLSGATDDTAQHIAGNLWAQTAAEQNPLWEIIARDCGVGDSGDGRSRMSTMTPGEVGYAARPSPTPAVKGASDGGEDRLSGCMGAVPLTLTDAEIIRPANRVRWIKSKPLLEHVPAYPYWGRGQTGWEFKRSQFRAVENVGKAGNCEHSGLEYLQVWWGEKAIR